MRDDTSTSRMEWAKHRRHMHKLDDGIRPQPNSFVARVARVSNPLRRHKTVSLTLVAAQPHEGKLRRAILVGVASRKATGMLVEDEKDGLRAHIFFDAKTLRGIPKDAIVQLDWSPVGRLMTNIALTITAPDYDKDEPSGE